MIVSFFSLVILCYGLALIFAAKTWKNLPELSESGELKSVTVIIPFRNESSNLQALLKSVEDLDYPSELLEIVLINDHSSDDYMTIIESFQRIVPYKVTLINLPQNLSGKKSAILEGVGRSRAEIILTSDADCIFPKDWVQKMQAPFEIEGIHLVSGNIVFEARDLLSRLFQMEFAPLIGVGAVTIELGNATMANGANLAFRRATFLELQPYSNNMGIPSGDDIFLLQKIKSAYPGSVFFQSEAVVTTNPPEDLYSFFKQRKRWAAKWNASRSLVDLVPAAAVWLFHLIYILSIFYSIKNDEFLFLVPVLIFKILAEGVFIFLILKSQKYRFSLVSFALLQLVYSFYVVIFGLVANYGSYTWKERKYKSNERAGN